MLSLNLLWISSLYSVVFIWQRNYFFLLKAKSLFLNPYDLQRFFIAMVTKYAGQ